MIARIVRLATAYMDWTHEMRHPHKAGWWFLLIYGLYGLMIAAIAGGYIAFG